MNETQFKPGDLVKYMADGDRGIVVKVGEDDREHFQQIWVYWFRDGIVLCFFRNFDILQMQLLSRGHNNE